VLFATTDSTGYKIVFLLHILFAIIAFGAPFVNPSVTRFFTKSGGDEGSLAGAQAQSGMMISLPAVVITGILGMGLIGLSDKVYKFSATWVSIAFVVWVIQIVLFAALIVPTLRKVAAEVVDADKRVMMYGGLMHLTLIIMLWLMVFKPGGKGS